METKSGDMMVYTPKNRQRKDLSQPSKETDNLPKPVSGYQIGGQPRNPYNLRPRQQGIAKKELFYI